MNKIMKSAIIFKQMFIAMAALTMVGCLSSCKDQNFDWDYAHANTKQERFTNVFIKEFGKPASNHDWGTEHANTVFSFANTSTKAKTRASDDNTDGRIYKQDMSFSPYTKGITNAQFGQWGEDANNEGLFQRGLYEKPKDILPGEHHDVFAWFSKHRVYWVNTPVDYNYKTDGVLSSRWCYQDGILKNVVSKDRIFAFYQEEVDKSGNKMQNDSDMEYESIQNYSDNYATQDYSVVNYISFSNGWIQHVAYDATFEKCDSEEHESKYNGANMNYLCFRPIEENKQEDWTEYHGYDFNAAQGYGWDNQYYNNNNTYADSGKDWMTTSNALLYYGFDFNDVFYGCSAGSSVRHNKFLLAKLHGVCKTTGKEWGGYYLGLDLESTGSAQEVLSANGWCNDWIIKIGDFGDNIFEKFRIMCEDLGDPENVNSGLTISDIDYNDIVLDVEPEGNINIIKLTLQAAGGTLPLTVWYKDTPLFETHELFQNNAIIGNYNNWADWNYTSGNDDANRQKDVNYQKMYNTNAVSSQRGTVGAKSIYLVFNNTYSNITGKAKPIASGNFNITDIKLKIYRFGEDDYKSNNGSFSQAEWVELANQGGEAPIMLYIPKYNIKEQEVLWMNEYNNISLGYSGFKTWVQYPTKPFWEPDINSNNTYLYPNNNPSDKAK